MDANERMIRDQIEWRGVRDPRVLAAFRSVPREDFVPPHLIDEAYADSPLPLMHGQTISQPYIVAYMTERLHLRGDERVLEIGTGSGYQTAILARLAREVFSAEIEPELAATVQRRLDSLGITNVHLRVGNGVEVFRDSAPFGSILSAAAPDLVPDKLLDQLGEGGRCIIPVGTGDQFLWMFERIRGEIRRHRLDPVRFVPLRETPSSA